MQLPKIMQESGLFWEYDPKAINIEKHKALIVRRVLEFGDLAHIQWIFGQYGKDAVQKVFETSAPLGRKSDNFWNIYFKSDICTKKQLTQEQSAFLSR